MSWLSVEFIVQWLARWNFPHFFDGFPYFVVCRVWRYQDTCEVLEVCDCIIECCYHVLITSRLVTGESKHGVTIVIDKHLGSEAVTIEELDNREVAS